MAEENMFLQSIEITFKIDIWEFLSVLKEKSWHFYDEGFLFPLGWRWYSKKPNSSDQATDSKRPQPTCE